MSENITKNSKKIFNQIDSSAWEHPSDKAALKTLKTIPLLDDLVRNVYGMIGEKAIRLFFKASTVKVSENQFPRIHNLLLECCQIFDNSYIPELYISFDPHMNAGAVGLDKPFIVLYSSLIEKMTDQEIMYIIGHELGHIYSGHALYRTIVWLILKGVDIFTDSPVIKTALMAVSGALLEWSRKAELSCDRAGFLCVQDVNIVYNAMMKFSGGAFPKDMNMDEFIKQAEAFETDGDMLDGVYKVLLTIQLTHPFPVVRVLEIKKWIENGEYDKILSGDYSTRETEKESGAKNFFQNYQKAADQYRDDLKTSKDPLLKTVSMLTESIDQATEQAQKFVNNIFNFKNNEE